MKNQINRKLLLPLICAAALLFFSSDFASAQSLHKTVKKTDWQISTAPKSDGRGATLGIRDKFGELGTFNTLFVVTAPNKRTFRKRARGTKDDWVYVDFPADFKGSQTAGIYKVTFYGNGVVIGRSNFKIGK